MEAFLVSTGVVALAEMGDKTQLLAFLLAAKFRKPLPIVLGIFVATLVEPRAGRRRRRLGGRSLGPACCAGCIGVSSWPWRPGR